MLAGDMAQLGPDHPHTLDSIYNLARLHQAEGNLHDALPLFRQEVSARDARWHPIILHRAPSQPCTCSPSPLEPDRLLPPRTRGRTKAPSAPRDQDSAAPWHSGLPTCPFVRSD